MSTQRMALEVCERCQNWRVEMASLGGQAMAESVEKLQIHPKSIKEFMGILSEFDNNELQIIRDYLNSILGN